MFSIRIKILALVTITTILGGCATKQYGRVQGLTGTEKHMYTCRDIVLEMGKVRAFEDQIEKTGETDWKTVFGALGDFGIGNGMAKDKARASARLRRTDLEDLWAEKPCEGSISVPISSSALEKPEASENQG